MAWDIPGRWWGVRGFDSESAFESKQGLRPGERQGKIKSGVRMSKGKVSRWMKVFPDRCPSRDCMLVKSGHQTQQSSRMWIRSFSPLSGRSYGSGREQRKMGSEGPKVESPLRPLALVGRDWTAARKRRGMNEKFDGVYEEVEGRLGRGHRKSS